MAEKKRILFLKSKETLSFRHNAGFLFLYRFGFSQWKEFADAIASHRYSLCLKSVQPPV